jgi:hypothetical protein
MGGPADTFRITAAGSLASGIQLILPFCSLFIAATIAAVLQERITRKQATTLFLLVAVIGSMVLVFSVVSSYVNYHETIQKAHLQNLIDIGIERMEGEYQLQREKALQNALGYIGVAVKQAEAEWNFWDAERKLQDSFYSPNQKGRGKRFSFAHTQAEVCANYLDFHTGARPEAGLDLSRQGRALSGRRSTEEQIERAFAEAPETLEITSEVAAMADPRQRYQHAFIIYKRGIGSLQRAFSRIPAPEVLQLPERNPAFEGRHLGDRVTIDIDGVAVSNIPVPPERPVLPELFRAIPEVPPSYEVLRDTIGDYYVAAGESELMAGELAARDALTLGENAWLNALAQLPNPTRVEWAAIGPAVIVDLVEVLLGILYGFASLLTTEQDPLWLLEYATQKIEAMIASLSRRASTFAGD